MNKHSLAKTVFGSKWLERGTIVGPDGAYFQAYEVDPLSSGEVEDEFEGPTSDSFYAKLSDLLSRFPDRLDCQLVMFRRSIEINGIPGFRTRLLVFEQKKKIEGYSYVGALLDELSIQKAPLSNDSWLEFHGAIFGQEVAQGRVPDLVWKNDHVEAGGKVVRVLSLTELPQVTWRSCLRSVFELQKEFVLSLKIRVPDRAKVKRQLETKRRVSHALAISTSLEVRNIESNSVLSSSEESLERILTQKETLFEISAALILRGDQVETTSHAREFERAISGIGNAGLFLEGVGSLPVLKSHLPGNDFLNIRKLPILNRNLSEVLPLFLDYSRKNDPSSLELRSRTGEISHLNLFSKENLNSNAFICGASGSGKSFFMNAILLSLLKDTPEARICIFDVGGSYRKLIQAAGGQTLALSEDEALAFIATHLRMHPVSHEGIFRDLLRVFCGSGQHITHSHTVAIDDLLREIEGTPLKIDTLIANAKSRNERAYLDVAHWLKPFRHLDKVPERLDLVRLIQSPVSAFDFKLLDSNPVLQRTTILLLTDALWRNLVKGASSKTLVVFDEVWRFFSQCKGFLEEMYRTLRKYRAGIVSITQNLSDYGDDAFAKMLFTNSFTKIFLQGGATAEFLKEKFDLSESDINRAISVMSKKPQYSEFFALTPNMSQVFRLYPTVAFYALANTENIATEGVTQ